MRHVVLALCLCLCVWPAFAAAPYLVTDLKTTIDSTDSSMPYYIGKANGIVYFVSKPEDDHPTLWRTDGTAAGTFQLLTLQADFNTFFPASLVVSSGNRAWFSARDAEGWKLWRSDGSVAGTVAVTTASPAYFFAVQSFGSDKILTLQATLRDLWVYDSNGFRLLTALHPSTAGWTSIAVMGNNAYIGTESGIWKTDGTQAGTAKFTTTPGFNLTVAGNRIFFHGSSAEAGSELWLTDGTAAGTHLVSDVRPGTASAFTTNRSSMVAFGNGVAFIGANGEFGVSDGTSNGTRVIRTGAPKLYPPMAVLGSVLFFGFDDGTHGQELWRSDGTDAGTRMIRDANTGPDSPINTIVAGATRVYYYGRDPQYSFDMFESDGTEAGTHVVNPTRGPSFLGADGYGALEVVGDQIFYSAEDREHGVEPWISDGTDAGTHLIANVAAEAAGSSRPFSLIGGADRVYFTATGDFDKGVWSSDGTSAGTRLVVRTPSNENVPSLLAASGNTLYMKKARSSQFFLQTQLWKSEGGAPGSETLVKDFNEGFNTPSIEGVFALNGRVYPIADDGRGRQLWVTDGTTAGTTKLTDFSIDVPTTPLSLAGQTYFGTSHTGTLFATDGTLESTRSVAYTIDTSVAFPLAAFGGSLLSFNQTRQSETLLWKFSGGAAGATIVKHFPGTFGSSPYWVSIGTAALFTRQQDTTHQNQLWKTDGTADGTQLLRDFNVGSTSRTLTAPVALGARAVFSVDDGAHGFEPWVSDGTAEGTQLLRDIRIGSGSSSAFGFFVADGIAYFAATDAEHGSELWQTDGTAVGTQLVADLEPGAGESQPHGFARVGNTLYFVATTKATGEELWGYPLTNSPAVTIDDVRVRENNSSAPVSIRLTRAATQRVTVAWETADDTAKAGTDYTAGSGSVTFEQGESVKTISVPVANNATPGTTRSFSVRLKNANAPIERTSAAVIIEDDDNAADVAVSLIGNSSSPTLNVVNNGPSLASNVKLCVALPVSQVSFTCGAPFELAAGETRSQQVQSSSESILARVTLWETDPNPANNARTWSVGGSFNSLYVSPPSLRVGETGTVAVGQSGSLESVQLTSSDPTVISVPPGLTIALGPTLGTATFSALKIGVATISATSNSLTRSVTVRVVGPGEPLRSMPVVKLDAFTVFDFGRQNILSATVKGLTLGGAQPTGMVTFYEDGHQRASAPLVSQRAAITIIDAPIGNHTYTATYGGDASFFDGPAASPFQVQMRRGSASFDATAVPGTSNVVITLRGVPGYAPSGTVTVAENGTTTRSVAGPLIKKSDSAAATTATGFSSAARTVAITYSGDTYYGPQSVTIPIGGPRVRSIRH